jgi:predicted nucleic acid-binding protein
MALAGEATIIVPAIVVAEFYFLSIKFHEPFTPSELIDAMKDPIGFEFSDLGMAQLEKLDDLQEIPEMHDRLIAAESLVLDAPVITRDRVFSNSSQIETVW